MLKLKKLIAAAAALLMLAGVAVSVHAAPDLDPAATGSLTVTVKDTETGQGLPGGLIAIYQAAQPALDWDGYTLIGDFARSEVSLDRLDSADLAAALYGWAADCNLQPLATAVPDEEGRSVFADLPLGLYLVAQLEAAGEHTAIAPFVVTIPQYDSVNDTWILEVDASPKTGTANQLPPPPPPEEPPEDPDPDLPQTGQLWWPVYLLGAMGALLVLLGLYRRRRADD